MYFIKATKGRNNIILYIATMFLVGIGYMLGQVPITLLALYKIRNNPELGTEEVNAFWETLNFSLLYINNNVGLALMIFWFVPALIAFMLSLRYMHLRPFKFVITPLKNINYKKIFFGFGLWFVLSLLSEGGNALLHPEVYFFNFKPINFIFLLLISLTLLPIQTSTEEFVMRGYIMPAVGFFSRNKWIGLAVSTIIFGLIHGTNPEVEKFGFWTMQIYYLMAGLFLGIITILDDSLELALGVHAATNIFGAAFFSFEGSVLQTDSLFKAEVIDPTMMTISFFIGAVIFMLICWKKYKWKWSTMTTFGDMEGDLVAKA